jgi:hypothetical protein
VTTAILTCAKISRRENATYTIIHARFSITAQPWRPLQPSEVFLMTNSSRLAAALGASLLLFATPVFAQSTAAPAAKSDTAAPAPMAKPAKVHSPESIECSKEADAKGLHGKERKKFRSECKKAAKDKK